MISADEARKATKEKAVVYLEYIEKEIEYAASNGETSVLLDNLPYKEWGKFNQSNEENEVLAKLRNLGFSVKHYFHAGTIGGCFTGDVSMGLKIDWSGDE